MERGCDALELWTDAKTDFWRETFYGFIRDSGHAFLRGVSGDFTASVTVLGDYEALYDQAGLLLRLDEEHWIKAGIEFTDGLMHFSVVVTSGVSDWSVIPLPTQPKRRSCRPADPPRRCGARAVLGRRSALAACAALSVFGCCRQDRHHGLLAAALRLSGGVPRHPVGPPSPATCTRTEERTPT